MNSARDVYACYVDCFDRLCCQIVFYVYGLYDTTFIQTATRNSGHNLGHFITVGNFNCNCNLGLTALTAIKCSVAARVRLERLWHFAMKKTWLCF